MGEMGISSSEWLGGVWWPAVDGTNGGPLPSEAVTVITDFTHQSNGTVMHKPGAHGASATRTVEEQGWAYQSKIFDRRYVGVCTTCWPPPETERVRIPPPEPEAPLTLIGPYPEEPVWLAGRWGTAEKRVVHKTRWMMLHPSTVGEAVDRYAHIAPSVKAGTAIVCRKCWPELKRKEWYDFVDRFPENTRVSHCPNWSTPHGPHSWIDFGDGGAQTNGCLCHGTGDLAV